LVPKVQAIEQVKTGLASIFFPLSRQTAANCLFRIVEFALDIGIRNPNATQAGNTTTWAKLLTCIDFVP
jgi:hypothetical protein